jgi:hypothetical protein
LPLFDKRVTKINYCPEKSGFKKMNKQSLTVKPFNEIQPLYLTNFTYTDANEKIWEVVAQKETTAKYGFEIIKPIIKIEFPATLELFPLAIKSKGLVCFGFYWQKLGDCYLIIFSNLP